MGSSSSSSSSKSDSDTIIDHAERKLEKFNELIDSTQTKIEQLEGAARQGNAKFNVNVYKTIYDDLRKAFGNNLPKYYEHYCKYGYKEGRKTN